MAGSGNKVIVLGASGFLGAYSCLELKRAGYDVVAVGHRPSDGGFFADHDIAYVGGFSIEREDCFDLLPTDPVAVVNLAGSMPARADFAQTDYVASIVTGTINLCEWMRARTSCKRIVFNTTPSDVWHAFKVGAIVGDDTVRRYPATGGDHDIYAIAKMAAVDVLDHYRLTDGISPIVFRHLNVYGFHPSAKYFVDGEERMSPWRILLRRAVAGGAIEVYGDGSRKLELLSVYDFAAAVVKAVEATPAVFGMFNLSGIRPYSLEEEIRTIVDVFGNGNDVIPAPEKPSRIETMLDRGKARRELGWEPQLDWRETCLKIREEFSANRFSKLWGEVSPEDVKRKTLAVVGASYLQLPLVRRAKEMGLRVICFAWPEGAVCAELCDDFYPISIVDRERILEVCRRERIDGVTSIASDVAVPTMAYVAEKMGLIGNSVESAAKSTDKYLMRQALAAVGTPCPKFVSVEDSDDVVRAVEGMCYPLIVKPADRSGSMGVTRVEDAQSLRAAVAGAIAASFGHKAIVEECVTDMREVSVEGLSWDGEYNFLQITDKTTTGAPHYVELAHHQPALVSEDLKTRIVDIVRKGVEALGIRYGATHAELMLTSNGKLYMTEIGARMGGDFIGSDLVMLSTGYDFLEGVIRCALGEFTRIRHDKHARCSGVWFYAPETKWVRRVIDGAANEREIVRAELQRDCVQELTKSADRSGYFIYAGERRIDAVE